MPLQPGSRLGVYEIVAPLGAGGMGEVYRARDTRLDRTVAIKILQSHLSERPEQRERFDREAKVISSLTHPNICTLYDVGHENGVDYLVMELLEGESLSDRVARGALPMQQVFRYGIDIANALDRAHRAGIMHRDLKPANVMITPSGAKLLDFGLAKYAPASERASSLASAAPTEQRPLTAEGSILGTLQYMAPEQLEGRAIDERTDIFSLGIVLYEMVTGRRPFSGPSQASVISSILTSEPAPITSLQPMASPVFDQLVRTCLEKSPDDRWRNAHDIATQLKWMAQASGSHSTQTIAVTPTTTTARRIWGLAGFASLLLLLGMGLFFAYTRLTREPGGVRGVVRFHLPKSDIGELHAPLETNNLAVSPDGRSVAYGAVSNGKRGIWIRSLQDSPPRYLEGTTDAVSPTWSVDGESILFVAEGSIKSMRANGGAAETLCQVSPNGASVAWGADGTILFAETAGGRAGIFLLPPGANEPRQLTRPDFTRKEQRHQWPLILPDGKNFLYLAAREGALAGELLGATIDKPAPAKVILKDVSRVLYLASGHLVFVRNGTLFAQEFDQDSLVPSGVPVAIADHVHHFPPTGSADFSMSSNGTLVYQSSRFSAKLRSYDMSGQELVTISDKPVLQFDLSHDGKRIVAGVYDPRNLLADIWVIDPQRNVSSRLTSDPGLEFMPRWSPDSSTIVYARGDSTPPQLVKVQLRGDSTPIPLRAAGRVQYPWGWTPDGKRVIFSEADPVTRFDIWSVSVTDPKDAVVLVRTPFDELKGTCSPNAEWLAFTSNESGSSQLYVQPFNESGERIRVSENAGDDPHWSGDGSRLYFLAKADLYSVRISKSNDGLEIGAPVKHFTFADGQPVAFRVKSDNSMIFAAHRFAGEHDDALTVVLNATDLLKAQGDK